MRKRTLSLLLAGTFLVGTAAACSDDDGGGGDSGGNAEVQAYCDDVDALADQLDGADASVLAGITDELTALQESATDLAASTAELTPDDSVALQACTSRLSDAAAGLAGG